MTAQSAQRDENLLLTAALKYAGRGWHVFPVNWPLPNGRCSCTNRSCADVGKHPRTSSGFKDATADREQLEKWWKVWPDANVGIACGASELVVLDIDPRHGGDESLADLREKHGDAWLDTVTGLTGGGGTHYLYKAPAEGSVRNAANVFAGIDIRGDGGYIVAPPSLHVSGQRYTWERTANEVEPAPWPVDIIRTRKAPAAERAAPIPDSIPSGTRNEALTSLAGTMRHRGVSEAAIAAALRVINSERCVPPLPDVTVQTIARSVCRYPAGHSVLLKIKSAQPVFSHLRKKLTKPPTWILRVHEADIVLPTNVLMNYRALCEAVLEQATLWVPEMRQAEWTAQLKALTEDVEYIEAPEDASEEGNAWTEICSFLSRRSDIDERFAQGKPLERDDVVLVTGSMLRKALRLEGVNLKQTEIWEIVQAHGGEVANRRIAGLQKKVWAIPLLELPAKVATNGYNATDATNLLSSPDSKTATATGGSP